MEHTVKDILGRFDHVDYLVNNAGRSIRRSVVNSTERLHDYERVMAVNYFGAVRMVLALLPHWRERRFGHVVNVSSAGVQARNPKYSSYLPSKAALDAFADVVGSETLSDHITFTNIHMPLVRTPMIAPSHRLNPVPAISPERAAAMVVRGLEPGDNYMVSADTETIEDAKKKHLIQIPEYILSVIRSQPGSREMKPIRVITFHRDDLMPYEQDLYDAEGNLETHVSYANYRSFNGTLYPTSVVIKRPLEEFQLMMTVEKVVQNMQLTDDQFQIKIPDGTTLKSLE